MSSTLNGANPNKLYLATTNPAAWVAYDRGNPEIPLANSFISMCSFKNSWNNLEDSIADSIDLQLESIVSVIFLAILKASALLPPISKLVIISVIATFGVKVMKFETCAT